MKWQIGAVTVTKVVEPRPPAARVSSLPQATPEAVLGMEWMKPHFMSDEGRLKMSIHALVIEAGGRRIVVDTCLGNDKQGRHVPTWNNLQGSFLQDLAAAGFPRESIDIVMCTHLHVDHVGWNTMLVDGRWVPTFPNARYLMARTEFEYWRQERDNDEQVAVFSDSVRPVFEAGLVDLVETDHRVCDEVRLVPTVGHTPGHVSVAISSQGQEALITGDFCHHPARWRAPTGPPPWTTTPSSPPAPAARCSAGWPARPRW